MSIDERATGARQIAVMRGRAEALRALAEDLEHTPAIDLGHAAGHDTWRSPRADACRELLAAGRLQLLHAAADLRWQAVRLERRAADVAQDQARLDAIGAS